MATYDEIGTTYSTTRVPDARIQAQIDRALGDAVTVVNVGAGAGSYEPAGREVVAVEPSGVMIGTGRRARRRACRPAPRTSRSPTARSTPRWPC